MTSLFHLLTAFKDGNGNYHIITANCLVANPDFDKIHENGIMQYHHELITEAFSRYPKHMKCFRICQQGLENKVFKPQCHGRQQLNVKRFLEDLRTNYKDMVFALILLCLQNAPDFRMRKLILLLSFPLLVFYCLGMINISLMTIGMITIARNPIVTLLPYSDFDFVLIELIK